MVLFSILQVDSVDGSTVLVLHLPVATSDSHEGVSGLLLTLLGSGDFLFQLLEELDGLGILVGKLVGKLLFFDLSHFGVLVEGGLSNWDDAFDDIPEDTLVTWSGSERALVGPSLVEVDLLDELVQIQVVHATLTVIFLVDQFSHESVVPLNVGLRISDVHLVEVFFRHNLEEETEDTSSELRVVVLTLLVEEMNNVHFKVEELAIDGMFTWGMEVELDTVEGTFWNMGVKK